MVARHRVGAFMIISGFCVGESLHLPLGCDLVHLGKAAYTDDIARLYAEVPWQVLGWTLVFSLISYSLSHPAGHMIFKEVLTHF